jgi:AbrB family looped-hinge helix DNA binding protein
MSKVTSKYQLTLPKRIADHYAIHPGDQVEWVVAGDVIRVIPPHRTGGALDREAQLRLFDQATERLRQRPAVPPEGADEDRGWTRGDLYRR